MDVCLQAAEKGPSAISLLKAGVLPCHPERREGSQQILRLRLKMTFLTGRKNQFFQRPFYD